RTVPELRLRYAEVFGEATRAGHKSWLIKRIAWRLQALAEGDLSVRARQRAAALARDADLRLSPPRPTHTPAAEPGIATHAADPPALPDPPPGRSPRAARLPRPGATPTRLYKGRLLEVTILANGFAFAGKVYRSLSAVAKAVTGSHCNGF